MLFVTLSMRAQFDAAFTNTWALQSYYNPAARVIVLFAASARSKEKQQHGWQ